LPILREKITNTLNIGKGMVKKNCIFLVVANH